MVRNDASWHLKLGGNSKPQLLVAVTNKYAHVWVFALY